MAIKPAEMAQIYYGACEARAYKGSDAQLKIWRQMLAYAEKRDLEKALVFYWRDNTEFPMPAELGHLVERARRERLAVSSGPKERVEYTCPSCGAPFSTFVDPGDTRPRLCMVANPAGDLLGCRVRLVELSRTATR